MLNVDVPKPALALHLHVVEGHVDVHVVVRLAHNVVARVVLRGERRRSEVAARRVGIGAVTPSSATL